MRKLLTKKEDFLKNTNRKLNETTPEKLRIGCQPATGQEEMLTTCDRHKGEKDQNSRYTPATHFLQCSFVLFDLGKKWFRKTKKGRGAVGCLILSFENIFFKSTKNVSVIKWHEVRSKMR